VQLQFFLMGFLYLREASVLELFLELLVVSLLLLARLGFLLLHPGLLLLQLYKLVLLHYLLVILVLR